MAAADALANGIENLQVNDDQSNAQANHEQADAFVQQWGFALDELYKIALKFFKGMRNFACPALVITFLENRMVLLLF